jgi:C4-dicarboxylate-specific signal transduction histidine kinase
MPAFAQLSDEDLKARLATLQCDTGSIGERARSERLQLDLQVHQIELEMQNRELREAQLALEVARDRYADLYDFSPVGYLTFDAKGCVCDLNLTGATVLGMERTHVIGQPFTGWLMRGETGAFFAHLRKVAQAGRSTAVVRIKGPGPNPRTVRLDSIAQSGQSRACRTAMTDITEAKERELAEREREAEFAHLARVNALGVMTTMMAHEIAQPLTAILADTESALYLLRHEPRNPELAIEAMEQAVLAAHCVGAIVHSIRNFSRKGGMLRATIGLNTVVHDAVRLLASTARDHNIQIEMDLAEGLPQVVGNSIQLEQVVVNLVSNAIDSIDARDGTLRRIILRTALEDTKARLSVADTGGGLTREIIECMFKPFFSTKPHGHGIGLALCRTIIQSHGGNIWATSNDIGATVAFDLPTQPHETAVVDLTARRRQHTERR